MTSSLAREFNYLARCYNDVSRGSLRANGVDLWGLAANLDHLRGHGLDARNPLYVHLCSHCNQSMERQQSRSAMGR